VKRPSRSSLAFHFALCAMLFALFGCGYHLRSSGEPIGWSLDSLAIPMMTSTSSVVGFESDFTRIVRDEFISHAKVPLLAQDEARYVLVGHIRDIRTDPQSYSFLQQNVSGHKATFEETNRRRLRVTLSVSLEERGTGKVIWREGSMETRASFDVGTDPLANQYNERLALERIARQLAQRIYMRTMERF
jgi:outer membrane lipopolysaccharide assembly protein LptE/RlpB